MKMILQEQRTGQDSQKWPACIKKHLLIFKEKIKKKSYQLFI